MIIDQKPTFLVYNASAGSGKTYSLVKSFLSKILIHPQPDYFKHILAITFTNKAVSEMKSRILSLLIQFAKGHFEGQAGAMAKDLSKELNFDLKTLQQRSEKILKVLLNNYALFSVETIDQFNHRILRTFARDLKLSSQFEVSMDTPYLLAQAVDRLIDKAGENEEITNMLLQFALQKTTEDKSWDISFDLKKSAGLLVDENNREELFTLKNTTTEQFESLQTKLKNALNEKEAQISEAALSLLQLFEERGIEASHFTGGYLYSFFEKISKGDFNQKFDLGWQQKIGVENLYPKKITDSEAQAIDSVVPQILDAFNAIKSEIYTVKLLNNLLKNLVPLATVHLVDLELQALKEENNLLPIYEFNRIIHKEIKNQPAPFIYERLGDRYKHFFIDEFQDTSSLQWENLIPLADNSLSQIDPQLSGGSLMIVGDAKQSIYRWRGGLPEQFINLYQDTNPFPFVEKECVNLDTNFRSCRQIVAFNNDFFSFAASFFGDDSHQLLYKTGNQQKQHQECEGYVHIDFIEDLKKEETTPLYSAMVYEKIESLFARGYSAKDICILTRKRDEGVAISEYLVEKNIAVISDETLLLKNSKWVKALLHLFQLQLVPNHDEVKMEFLEFLHAFLNINEELYAFLAPQIGKPLSELSKKLTEFGIVIDFRKAQSLGLYENFEYFIHALQIHEEADAFVTTFMDWVLQFTKRPQNGKLEFLDYWELQKDKLSVSSQNTTNAITVMTIHKSKGLEFPVVIFPFADLDIYNEIDPKTWFPYNEDGFETLLINFNKDVEHFGESGARIYNERRNTLELDNINLLYVALTRARNELFIVTKDEKDKDDPVTFSNYFKLFLIHSKKWQEGITSYSFGHPQEIIKELEKDLTEETLNYIVSLPEEHPIKLAHERRFDLGEEQETAIQFGTIFHELMSRIETAMDVEVVLDQMKEDAAFDQEIVQKVEGSVIKLINHAGLKTLFSGEDQVLNEKEIVTSSGIVRPDRINLHEDGSLTIIDFKTGSANSSHAQQIEQYGMVLENMNYSVRKKLLVYVEDEGIIINNL